MARRLLKRHFAFLFPDDQRLQELLDLAIFILNPAEKLSAHITVAGPFNDPRSLPEEWSFVAKICGLGVDRFTSSHQNTIFIKVDAHEIKEVWNKPDFPYNPHLTLYDGDDWELADRLYEALYEQRMYFCFYVSRLTHIALIKGQGSWDLLSRVNLSHLPELKGKTPEDVKAFTIDERIFWAVEALKRAKYHAHRVERQADGFRALA
jgi:hypothetical protein